MEPLPEPEVQYTSDVKKVEDRMLQIVEAEFLDKKYEALKHAVNEGFDSYDAAKEQLREGAEKDLETIATMREFGVQ